MPAAESRKPKSAKSTIGNTGIFNIVIFARQGKESLFMRRHSNTTDQSECPILAGKIGNGENEDVYKRDMVGRF